jgi:hypothetical protein
MEFAAAALIGITIGKNKLNAIKNAIKCFVFFIKPLLRRIFF